MQYESKPKHISKEETDLQLANIEDRQNKNNALHKHDIAEAKNATKLYIIISYEKEVLYVGFDEGMATQAFLTNDAANFHTVDTRSDAIDKGIKIVKVVI